MKDTRGCLKVIYKESEADEKEKEMRLGRAFDVLFAEVVKLDNQEKHG